MNVPFQISIIMLSIYTSKVTFCAMNQINLFMDNLLIQLVTGFQGSEPQGTPVYDLSMPFDSGAWGVIFQWDL